MLVIVIVLLLDSVIGFVVNPKYSTTNQKETCHQSENSMNSLYATAITQGFMIDPEIELLSEAEIKKNKYQFDLRVADSLDLPAIAKFLSQEMYAPDIRDSQRKELERLELSDLKKRLF